MDLTSWHRPLLGLSRFPSELTEFEISYFFTLTPEDQTAIRTRRGELHRVAAAVHIGFIRMSGRTLDSFDYIPRDVLKHLSAQLRHPVPDLSTVRALYSRKRTLFEHQEWTIAHLGFRRFNDRRQRVLTTHLNKGAEQAVTISELESTAYEWLYTRQILIPSRVRIDRLVRKIRNTVDRNLLRELQSAVPEKVRFQWVNSVLSTRDYDETHLEWLQKPPKKRSEATLLNAMKKRTWLMDQKVHHYDLSAIPFIQQQRFARRIQQRTPARFRRDAEPRRNALLVCFLQNALLQLNDIIISLIEMKLLSIKRQALQSVLDNTHHEKENANALLRDIRALLEDKQLSDAVVRSQLLDLVPTLPALSRSRAAQVRYALSNGQFAIRRLAKRLLQFTFQGNNDPLLTAVSNLRAFYELRLRALPNYAAADFARAWHPLIEGWDRQRAFRAYEAAVLFELIKSLKNGSVWVPYSLSHRQRDRILISEQDWQESHEQHYQELNSDSDPDTRTIPLLNCVLDGLQDVDSAICAGDLALDDKGFRLPKLSAVDEHEHSRATRQLFFDTIGEVQFPDLIVSIDSQTAFTTILLGQSPQSDHQLLALYAALLVDGTAQESTEIAKMIDGVTVSDIRKYRHLFHDPSVMRSTNDCIVKFMLRHPIVKYWGDGKNMSSDAKSLDAPRHLWNARLDPKRQVKGMGMYSHVMDQWGIAYDLPIVLGNRQAGAAIEGAVRQTLIDDVEFVAVDTHGYTYFAVAVAKILGFDLLPRLRNFKEQKLHLPKSIEPPLSLGHVATNDVSMDAIDDGWDELNRVAASIKSGTTSATLALQRFGSASRADPIHKAGVNYGKLLLTKTLIDLMLNADYRRTLHRILSHGESIHALQRIIYRGGIAPSQGRNEDSLLAISGSLTLLTNLVTAWNTQQMQRVIDQWTKERTRTVSAEIMKSIAPVHSAHINFRGKLNFHLTKHRALARNQ